MDLLPHHLKECEHNPKKPVSCLQGCGLTVPKDEMKVTHLFDILDVRVDRFVVLFEVVPS